MRSFLLMAALASAGLGQRLPVTGVAGARFHVNDLAKAHEFYTKVFGFQEKKTGDGMVAFRINGEQYVEFSAGDPGSSGGPLEMIALVAAGKPAPLKDQDGRRVEFVASAPGSFKAGAGSISDHLLHVGMDTPDLKRSSAFYEEHFEFKEDWRGPTPEQFQIVILRAPGPREDFVEFLIHSEQGWKDHICLDVPDIQQAFQTLGERGATMRGKPRIASNGHWVLNMADPNGIRVELMEPRPAPK